ncbi:MAG TPA: surface carbohydrate biosynthesis protein, partial [Thermoanaerobaculia bacterium]
RRGATCHLVPLNLQDREVPALAPDYVLLNYFRLSNQPLAARLVAAGIPFGVHDTEGGVWENPDSYTELLWKDAGLRSRTAVVCMWGRALADHVVAAGLLESSQVAVTGCARFDFYESSWRSVLNENGARRRGNSRILVNTNFSVSNPRFTTREQSIAYCHREYGWSLEAIRKVTDAEDEAIRGTLELVRDLSHDFPGAEIVLRPHPFEDPALYREAVGALPCVTVNDTGPVQPQIGAASVVIQRSCTTAIEAVAAGVPTLSPLWIPAPYLMPVAESVSVPCEGYPQMRARLKEIFSGSWSPPAALSGAAESAVSDWFFRIDGRAHTRVANAIASGIAPRRAVDERLCRRYFYGVDREDLSVAARLGARLRRVFSLSPDFSFRQLREVPLTVWTKTSKHLDLGEARTLLERIGEAGRRQGEPGVDVAVARARDRDDYLIPYEGQSLTVTAAGHSGA